jgi:hypothetical protein
MDRNCVLVAIVALAGLVGCGGGGSKPAATTTQSGPTPTAQSMTQVVLESPKLGNVSNPLDVKASATSRNGISGWIVYVDDAIAVQSDNHQATLSASVPLSTGTHTMYVRAWDVDTVTFATSQTLQVNVDGTQATVAAAAAASSQTAAPAPGTSAAAQPAAAPPPPPRGPLPDVPGDAKIWENIQDRDGWESCSGCAGGESVTDNFWTAGWQSSPSRSGSSREFMVDGPPWGAALWINKLGQNNWASHFLLDFWVRFDETSASQAWTAEYDLWQSINGQEFMIGTHCNFGENHWDIWDSRNWHWVPTDVGCPSFSPNEWHHIQFYFERWGSHEYHYGIIVVDGNAHELDRTFESNDIDWSDGLGVQWQLDQDGSGAPLHEWIDNVKLSIW